MVASCHDFSFQFCLAISLLSALTNSIIEHFVFSFCGGVKS